LYGKDLTLELQDALGDDYPQFLVIMQNAQSGNAGATQTDLSQLVIDLNNNIGVFTWTSRDLTPFHTLYRLDDTDFQNAITTYNSNYNTDFKTDLAHAQVVAIFSLNMGASDFDDLKKGILARISALGM
jgi:uncharacterized protein YihD (DUF1040 family)